MMQQNDMYFPYGTETDTQSLRHDNNIKPFKIPRKQLFLQFYFNQTIIICFNSILLKIIFFASFSFFTFKILEIWKLT